jgi:hypothetical protein
MNLPDALDPPGWAAFVAWALVALAIGLLVRAVGGLDLLGERPAPGLGAGRGSRPD